MEKGDSALIQRGVVPAPSRRLRASFLRTRTPLSENFIFLHPLCRRCARCVSWKRDSFFLFCISCLRRRRCKLLTSAKTWCAYLHHLCCRYIRRRDREHIVLRQTHRLVLQVAQSLKLGLFVSHTSFCTSQVTEKKKTYFTGLQTAKLPQLQKPTTMSPCFSNIASTVSYQWFSSSCPRSR